MFIRKTGQSTENQKEEFNNDDEEFINLSKIQELSNVYQLNLNSEIPQKNVEDMVDDMIQVAVDVMKKKELEEEQ